jgi:hypothetical protein
MPLLHLEALPPRTTKGEILHLLIGEGGIGRALVGKIDQRGSAAAIEVPPGWESRLARPSTVSRSRAVLSGGWGHPVLCQAWEGCHPGFFSRRNGSPFGIRQGNQGAVVAE